MNQTILSYWNSLTPSLEPHLLLWECHRKSDPGHRFVKRQLICNGHIAPLLTKVQMSQRFKQFMINVVALQPTASFLSQTHLPAANVSTLFRQYRICRLFLNVPPDEVARCHTCGQQQHGEKSQQFIAGPQPEGMLEAGHLDYVVGWCWKWSSCMVSTMAGCDTLQVVSTTTFCLSCLN